MYTSSQFPEYIAYVTVEGSAAARAEACKLSMSPLFMHPTCLNYLPSSSERFRF